MANLKNIIFLILIVCISIGIKAENINNYKYAILKPINYKSVNLLDGMLNDIRNKSRDIGVPTLYNEFEKHGYVDNFRICAEKRRDKHIRRMNCNEFIYKNMSAMAWYSSESEVSRILLDSISRIVLSAQQPDGYLNTYYENILLKEKGVKRFAPFNRCEFLNFGHFTQAAIADYLSNGNRKLLDAAIRFANLIIENFSYPNHLPYKLYQGPVNKKYEHPCHEMAMVDLYRVTGDKRFLDFAKQTITEYGYFGNKYFNEVWGHAVQENLLQVGAMDVYLEDGDDRILEVSEKLWNDVVNRKMYITGGTGCVNGSESYGKAYELPNATAYSETCAAIALFFWHYKMLLATGDPKYVDEMERTLYNNILAGYGLDGKSYFYQNPLEWDSQKKERPGHRFKWHHCPCCPPYIHRLLSMINQYIYTKNNCGLQVNLYINSSINYKLNDGNILLLKQNSNYPYDDRISFTMTAPSTSKGFVYLRVPDWCKNPEISIDSTSVDFEFENGYIKIDTPWAKGKEMVLNLSMKPLIIKGNHNVEDQINKVAIQRGPIIYCAEQIDNVNIDLSNLMLSENPKIEVKPAPDILGGTYQLCVETKDCKVKMIPYFLWANRSESSMKIWLPLKSK